MLVVIYFEKWNNVRAQQTKLQCEVLQPLARTTKPKRVENEHYEITGGRIIK
jgi:hypothetical protein